MRPQDTQLSAMPNIHAIYQAPPNQGQLSIQPQNVAHNGPSSKVPSDLLSVRNTEDMVGNQDSKHHICEPESMQQNIDHLLDVMRTSGLSIPSSAASALCRPQLSNTHDRELKFLRSSPAYDLDILLSSGYSFKDMRTNEVFTHSAARTEAVLDMLGDIRTNKHTSFVTPESHFGSLTIKPLEGAEYASGVPFGLSCKTGHCDFIGAKGGNYPLAEYLSDSGHSFAIYRGDEYVGHMNVWRTHAEAGGKDLTVGTIALDRNRGISSRELRGAVSTFAIDLLRANQDVSSIYLGLGGQNLSVLHGGVFEMGSRAALSLGKIRHAEPGDLTPDEVSHVQELTGWGRVAPLGVRDEGRIGMMPSERLDFKNGIEIAQRSTMDALSGTIDDSVFRGEALRSKAARTEYWAQQNRSSDSRAYIEQLQAAHPTADIRIESMHHQDIYISCNTDLAELVGGHEISRRALQESGRILLKLRRPASHLLHSGTAEAAATPRR